jgi:RNA polymerase sigma-70 factor (ECF subfamily)
MLQQSSLADDLTQETFTRVIVAAQAGRLPERARPWIYQIATNLCKDLWKKSSYRNEQSTDQEALSRHQDRETITSILERQWEREAVVSAVQSLSEDHRHIVILRFYHELKLEEIAEIVGIPLSTLKSRLYQSLKKLADILRTEEEVSYGNRQNQHR